MNNYESVNQNENGEPLIDKEKNAFSTFIKELRGLKQMLLWYELRYVDKLSSLSRHRLPWKSDLSHSQILFESWKQRRKDFSKYYTTETHIV